MRSGHHRPRSVRQPWPNCGGGVGEFLLQRPQISRARPATSAFLIALYAAVVTETAVIKMGAFGFMLLRAQQLAAKLRNRLM